MEKIIRECRATNKQKDKIEILRSYAREYSDLKKLLYRTYEPFETYHLASNIKTEDYGRECAAEAWPEFENILDVMKEDHSPFKNKKLLLSFLPRCNRETQELFLGVIRKDLKIGAKAKLINRAFPGLITEFDVMLGKQYDRDKNYNISKWKASYKMEGLRLIALYNFPNTGWNFLTRKGKKVENGLPHLVEGLDFFKEKWGFTFFDGEAYAHGIPFEKIQGDMLDHDGDDCSYIDFNVFAIGDTKSFIERSQEGMIIPSSEEVRYKSIVTVPHYDIPNDPDRMIGFTKKMTNKGYEGAMFRNPDIPYPYGRGNNLLKLKLWLLDGYIEEKTVVCTDIEGSVQMRPSAVSGRIEEIETLKSLHFINEATEETTKVGSGFTHKQKDEYWENRKALIGRKFDIKFQREGSRGRYIFPVFLGWRFDL